MRLAQRLLIPCLVILSLTVFAAGTPVHAAVNALPEKPLFTRLSDDFVKGALYYGDTVAGWFNAILRLFGVGKTTVADIASAKTCQAQADCSGGLACLNACAGDFCDVWEKKCLHGPEQIRVEPKYGACGKDDVCTKDTLCTSTCPQGVSCSVSARCLPIEAGEGSCTADLDCAATCSARGFPPIGVAALRPMCVAGSCRCKVEEANPDLTRVQCTDAIRADRNAICPPGTTSACTAAGCIGHDCPVRLTCLTAPEYGGTCFEDASCTNVSCPDNGTPFCDATEQKCRCRATKQEIVTCAKDEECGGITCDPGDSKVCRSNACACAKTTKVVQDVVCSAAADCPATCDQGFQAACVDGKCACQRTVSAPVSCTDVSQCGAVSCPAGFDKTCLKNVCSCARTVQQ